MLKIQTRRVKRKVTLDDFMKMKNDEGLFAGMRQDAKAVEFAALSGN